MKIKKLLSIFFLLTILSCSDKNDIEIEIEENLSPTLFEITLDQINDRSCNISWTSSEDPENLNITYEVYLNNELIEDNVNVLNYSFKSLIEDTQYNGKIIASDGLKKTSISFTFRTEPFTPLIYDGSVYLFTQQDVIDFGKNTYNIITGTLSIMSETGTKTDITDLTPLIDLMEVRGIVKITYSSLSNLEGLNNLTTIGDFITIHDNFSLLNLNGLENVVTITDKLWIFSNPLLEDISVFNKVTSIGGDISISANPKLKNIEILKEITNMRYLAIYENEILENINGFNNVKQVKFSIDINNNKELANISGFNNLVTIEGGLWISDSNITKLEFLNLIEIKEDFGIINNRSLQTLNGFKNLKNVFGNVLYIWNNSNLDNFCGITPLLENDGFSGSFSIVDNLYNPSITDILNGLCQPK